MKTFWVNIFSPSGDLIFSDSFRCPSLREANRRVDALCGVEDGFSYSLEEI